MHGPWTHGCEESSVRLKGNDVPIHLKRPPGAFQELTTGLAAQHGLSPPNSLKDFELSTPVVHTLHFLTVAHSLTQYRLASLPQSLPQACATKALLREGNTIPTGTWAQPSQPGSQ